MVRKLLFLWMAVILLGVSGATYAQDEKNTPETELSATSITIEGSMLHIYNANGCLLKIFSLTGTTESTIQIESDAQTVNLSLKKGCYIVQIKNVTRKIYIH